MNLTPDAKRKQKAIFHCLKVFLPEKQLMEAMLLWQDKHAHKKGFSVRYFADDVAALTGGKHTPKKLTLTMVSAIANPVADQSDPAEHIAAYRLQVGRYVASQKSTQVTAFNVLLNKLFLLAGGELASAVKTHLKTECMASPLLSGALKVAMQKALRSENVELLLGDVPVASLKVIVNMAYVALCDNVGPVNADRLLSQTLARLESNGGAQYSDIFKSLL